MYGFWGGITEIPGLAIIDGMGIASPCTGIIGIIGFIGIGIGLGPTPTLPPYTSCTTD